MNKPIWNRLKNFKCPLCNSDLKRSEIFLGYKCSKCNFSIREDTYQTMIKDMYTLRPMYKSHRQQEEENQNALNNL